MFGLCGLLSLSRGLLEEGDDIVPVLALLQTTESHLGAGNVLLGVFEVLKLRGLVSCWLCLTVCPQDPQLATHQSVLFPLDPLLLVRVGV